MGYLEKLSEVGSSIERLVGSDGHVDAFVVHQWTYVVLFAATLIRWTHRGHAAHLGCFRLGQEKRVLLILEPARGITSIPLATGISFERVNQVCFLLVQQHRDVNHLGQGRFLLNAHVLLAH